MIIPSQITFLKIHIKMNDKRLTNSFRSYVELDDELAVGTVVKQETDSSQEPAPECSTTWSPIDDDDDEDDDDGRRQQQTALGFCEIFIKEEPHEAEECFEEPESETSVESDPLMSRPSICSTSADINATQVGQMNSDYVNSISSLEKCTKSTVDGKEVQLYSCTHCSYKTPWRNYLTIHIRKHTGDKPFSCTYCDYKCARSNDLKVHLRTHLGVKPFSCKHCDFKASQKSHLKRHLALHTGEKPFICELCAHECTTLSNLDVHRRSHTGEKPFSCEFCDYRSSTSSHLKRHRRTHTGEKPYSCKFCSYKCCQSGQLKRHLRKHTG